MSIVVDTSAMVAILYGEPERERFRRVIERSPSSDLAWRSWQRHPVLDR